MSPTFRIGSLFAVLAIAVLGCGQPSRGQTGSAGPATTSASTAAASVEPSVAPSSAATPEEAEAPQPPVEFTGTNRCGPPVSPDREGNSERLDVGDEGLVLTRYRGGAWRQSVTMSDPRLEGTVYHTFENDEYAMPGTESGAQISVATRRIENEQGAWEERGYAGTFSDGTAIGDNPPHVWIGEGAYEGLIAIMESTDLEGACGSELRGVIFDGAPVPEPYNAR